VETNTGMDDSQWLTDSQLRVINPLLTDSQLWGEEGGVSRAQQGAADLQLQILQSAIHKVF